MKYSVLTSGTLTLFAVTLACTRLFFVPSGPPAEFTPLFSMGVIVTGVVVSFTDIRETSTFQTIRIEQGSKEMNILANVSRYPAVHVGDEVRVSGKLQHPQPFATDGGRVFAYDEFLRMQNIYAVIPRAQIEVIGISHSPVLQFMRVLEYGKEVLTKELSAALPEPESSLAVGLLIGGKQGLGKELLNAFTKAGMLQIIVLSGYNVMIVASALMRVLVFLPKRFAFFVATISIICFVAVSGGSSSALRAGLMATLALYARTFGKKYDVLRAVLVSAFVLSLWNPLILVYDPGFQFSFIATLGLIFLVPYIAPHLLFLRSAFLIELLATSIAAEISLVPFLLWQTGNFSVVSILANSLAMPAVPIAMGASFIALLLSNLVSYISPTLPLLLSIPAYIPLAYIIKVATLSASLPWANILVPLFPFGIVLLSYVCLGVGIVMARRFDFPFGSQRHSN